MLYITVIKGHAMCVTMYRNQLRPRSKIRYFFIFIHVNHVLNYSQTFSANLVEEVDGILHLYGLCSLDTLYAPPVTWQPVHIAFHYIEYDEIALLLGKLASRYSRIKVIAVISLLVWWELNDLPICRLLSLTPVTYHTLTSLTK